MLCLAASLTLATPALAAHSRVFFDAAACVASGAHSPSDCRDAEKGARMEFDKKAPRFASRAACERAYLRCMIGDIFAGGGVDFMPALRGFTISDGPRARAKPVMEGVASRGVFESRQIDRADENVSPAKGSAARLASARAAAHENQPIANDPRAYPVPEALLRDLQQRERRFGLGARN